MKKVLLLNQNGEPLSLIAGTRAIVLMLKGKVMAYEYYEDELIRSERETFQVPSVIGLTYYVSVPGARRVKLNKRNLLARDNFSCKYCGEYLSERAVTIDHIIPTSRGGLHEWKNVVASCKPCNNSKARRTPREAKMPIRGKLPWTPSRVIILRQKAAKLGYAHLKPYLKMA
jgi:5-methylcytosine-specific restriction endonuclease McrA